MNYSKLIDDLGGTSKVAEMFEVTTGAVSQWREDGIPRARLLHLKHIRPDLFQEDHEEKAA
jgi:hypothetical protein